MELNVQTMAGSSAGKISVSDDNFGLEFNEGLVHQVVTAYMAAARAGTHAQKTRSEVSGGGAKPFKQKGTGRARAGTIRSPIWRTGGKTFAAVTQDYSQKVNKKVYRKAIRLILSELVRQERLIVVDKIELEAPKTKLLASALKTMGLDSALIVTSSIDENLYLASRNLIDVRVCGVSAIDPVSLVGFDKVVVTADSLKYIEEKFA